MQEPSPTKIAALLKQIETEVLLKDRQAAATEFKLTTTAVKKYLKGDIVNADLALDLLLFFKQRLIAQQKPAMA